MVTRGSPGIAERGPAAVIVIGAGPAGLAAAARAGEAGARVTLVDDNPAPGGQIWRGATTAGDGLHPAVRWFERAQRAGVALRCQTRIVDAPAPGQLTAETPLGVTRLDYEHLILATGARERFLPFPGWTLPHVLGAGGLQALVKSGVPVAGKRLVVAGTGPLLLAVAAYLRQHGAMIAALCEQAPLRELVRFGARLSRAKVAQGWQIGRALAGVPLWGNAWPVAAYPGGVRLRHRGRLRELACDYLACGFHLVPNTELPALLGCAMQNGFVVVNERQCTTVPGVYCAGEPTGIGGVDLAVAQGEVAGLAAAGADPSAAVRACDGLRHFAAELEQVTRLRPELRALAQPDTLVCRCEDVSYERLRAHTDWRAAKLLTRCGMGPCQGRVCGAACDFLFGWGPESVRPPIFPVRIAGLAGAGND